MVANAASWTGSTSEPNARKVAGVIYYELTNANELAWFAKQVNSGESKINALLANDIVIVEKDADAICWNSIGAKSNTNQNGFEGNFDGRNFQVSGIRCNALFDEIAANARVLHLNVNGSVYARSGNIGLLAKRNLGNVIGVKSYGDVTLTTYDGHGAAGGIVGENAAGGIIDSSENYAKVTAYGSSSGSYRKMFGGIAGLNEMLGVIRNVKNMGTIILVNNYIMDRNILDAQGGIVGFNKGQVFNAQNSIAINDGHDAGTSNLTFIGGIAGINDTTGSVKTSYNRAGICGDGPTTRSDNVGGIAGDNYGTIENVFVAIGGSCITGQDYFGGIAGRNTSIVKNVYVVLSSLTTIGTSRGGVIGYNLNDLVNNVYYDGTKLSSTPIGDNRGLATFAYAFTTAQMTADQFAWILNTTNGTESNSGLWTRVDGINDGYPVLITDSTNYAPIVKIVFNDDGARTIRYTDYTGKVVMPSEPESYEDFTFVGWALENGKMVTESTVFSDDAIVDARYSSENALAYVVTFTSDNDEIIYTYITNENGKLSSLPEAPAPAEGYYFKGWYDEEFNRVNEITVFKANATLKALYGELSDVSYTITFKNADGTVLQTKTVKHGSIPEYTGAAPALEATAQYSYTFAAWDAAIVPATDDVVYTATYNATINSYTISFVDFDDSEIWSNVQPYGSSVVFGGVIPTRETTVAYSYTFKSWDKAVSNVTANATYKAVYDSTAITYEVVFKNGSVVLSTQQVEYGKAATAPASPTREGYLFSGWDKSFSKVTKELVVNALFDLAPTHQLIVYVDGEVVIETAPAEGSEYALPPAADKNGHTFLGWYDAEGNKLGDAGDKITIVDDITITAKYEINKYTITFMFGSTKLQSSQVEYNKMPTYDGVEPSREKTAAYTYEFAGWTPVVSAATKDQVYNAVFDSTLNKFTIVFKSAEGVLQTKSVGYGAVPAYTGAEPAKDPTAQYEYSFAGWDPEITSVTAAKTYTAVFDSTLRAYKVTFKVDGEVVQSKSVFYGSKPSYTGDEPSRAKSENYTYEFAGWTPEIKSVTGAQTYTAVFDSTKIAKPASSSSVPNSSSSSGKGESSSSNKGSSSSGDKDALTIVKAAPQFSVEVQGRTLQIAGAKSGAVYSLMDMQGRLLKQGTADANFTVEVPRAGTYLIRINKSISRVTVR